MYTNEQRQMDEFRIKQMQYLEAISPVLKERVKLHELYSQIIIRDGKIEISFTDNILAMDKVYIDILDSIRDFFFKSPSDF